MKTDNLTINNTAENNAAINVLGQQELILFTAIRNSMLEIFPLTGSSYPDDSVNLAECFALKVVNGVKQYVESKMNE